MLFSFLLGAAALNAALAAPPPATLPTVSPATFAPGRRWTWEYRDRKDNSVYSTERYTVAGPGPGGAVYIEMSTQYAGEGPFVLHHRMLVSVERCLANYRNPVEYKGWSFRLEHLNDGRWEEAYNGGNVLAFEEKFNCDPHETGTSRRYTLERMNAAEGPLFRHLVWGKLAGSWFHAEGPNAGVAARKDFSGRYEARLVPGNRPPELHLVALP